MKNYKDKENYTEGIDEEFQDLAAKLNNLDFSKDSNKDFVFEATIKNINYKGDNNMSKMKKTGVAVASLVILATVGSQATFAKDLVNTIKTISLSHFTAIQTDEHKGDNYVENLSDNIKGKLFDKNGSIIEKMTRDIYNAGVYTKGGEKVVSWNSKDGTIVTEKQKEEEEKKIKEETLIVTDKSKINDYTCFDVKLPNYLPEGYEFEKAEYFKDESGNVKDSKYANVDFRNKVTGKEISIHERFACDETKATLATDDKVENIKINGIDAVLIGGNSINWEANNTVYILFVKDALSKDEAVKIAESIK